MSSDSNPPINRAPTSPSTKAGSPASKRRVPFGRFFKHYKTGVVYDAWQYGHKAWPFGGSGKSA